MPMEMNTYEDRPPQIFGDNGLVMHMNGERILFVPSFGFKTYRFDHRIEEVVGAQTTVPNAEMLIWRATEIMGMTNDEKLRDVVNAAAKALVQFREEARKLGIPPERNSRSPERG